MPRNQGSREREHGQYTSEYSDDAFLEAIRAVEETGELADTVDVAQEVGCHRDTARRRLNQMAEEGTVERLEVGTSRVWRIKSD